MNTNLSFRQISNTKQMYDVSLVCRWQAASSIIVQLLSHVGFFVTPWTTAYQASCPSLSPGACSDSCPLSHWLFLYWSPVAYWAPTDLGSSSFSVLFFAFSYCSWGSQGKNTEVVWHSLLQWTTFCQTPPPWSACLGWPHMTWLSFIELDKAVAHMIRLAVFLWLWFQSVCPLMLSCSAYHLTWVSLALDVGYLFTAAPAKHSCCSLPWTWGISSLPLLLTLDMG